MDDALGHIGDRLLLDFGVTQGIVVAGPFYERLAFVPSLCKCSFQTLKFKDRGVFEDVESVESACFGLSDVTFIVCCFGQVLPALN